MLLSKHTTQLIVSVLMLILAIALLIRSCTVLPTQTQTIEHTIHDTTEVEIVRYVPEYRDRIRNVYHYDTILNIICDSNRNGYTGKLLAESDTQKLADNGLLVMQFYDCKEPFAFWHSPSADTTTKHTTTITTTNINSPATTSQPLIAVTAGWYPVGANLTNQSITLNPTSLQIGVGVVLWSY